MRPGLFSSDAFSYLDELVLPLLEVWKELQMCCWLTPLSTCLSNWLRFRWVWRLVVLRYLLSFVMNLGHNLFFSLYSSVELLCNHFQTWHIFLGLSPLLGIQEYFTLTLKVSPNSYSIQSDWGKEFHTLISIQTLAKSSLAAFVVISLVYSGMLILLAILLSPMQVTIYTKSEWTRTLTWQNPYFFPIFWRK